MLERACPRLQNENCVDYVQHNFCFIININDTRQLIYGFIMTFFLKIQTKNILVNSLYKGKNMKQKGSALVEDIVREYYTKLAFTKKHKQTRKKDCDKCNLKVACKRK